MISLNMPSTPVAEAQRSGRRGPDRLGGWGFWLLVWGVLWSVNPALPTAAELADTPKSVPTPAEKIDPSASGPPKADGAAPPPSFAETCLDDFYLNEPWPEEKDLLALLAPVAGQEARIEQARWHDQRACRLVGLWRVQPTWQPGSAVRLSLVERENLSIQIHVWAGRNGVSFRYYPHFHQTWAAFTTRRTGNQPRPESLQLGATDQGRYRRTGTGTITLYWHEGRLTLARGDAALVSLPFTDSPQEVYLDGQAVVRGMALFRLSDGPPKDTWPFDHSPVSSPSIQMDLPRLAWQTGHQEKARFRALEDGAVEWSADARSGDVQTMASVVPAGMYQWTFQVDDPQPGTGILWANSRGEVQARLCFFRDRSTGRTTFALVPGWHREIDRNYEQRRYTPWIEGVRWFRLVHGAGVVKLFTSPDGRLWSQTEPEECRIGEPLTQIGLFCWDGQQERSVRLRHLNVQRVEVLESLVPAELRQKAAEVAQNLDPHSPDHVLKASNPEEWEKRLAACRPSDTPQEEWRRAWMVYTLTVGPIPGWGPLMLYQLAREAMDHVGQVEEGLRLLEQLAVLFPAASDWPAAEQWAACYDRLARRAEDLGEANIYPAFWRSFVVSPFWPQRDWPPVLERLVWYELIRAMSQQRLADASELCRRLRFRARAELLYQRQSPWNPQTEHLIRMAEEACARRRLAVAPDRPSGQEADYRPPLLEQWGREAYNVKTEWEAALTNGQLREACLLLQSVGRPAWEGLLPDEDDPDLLLSLPSVVSKAMQQTPALREKMRQEFGARGQLRLRQAIQAGDAEAVELLTVQWAGTEAAVQARQYLGDRALAGGRFAEAAGHYRQALQQADPQQKPLLQARWQLALALQGKQPQNPLAPAFRLPGGPPEGEQKTTTIPNFPQVIEDLVRVRSAWESESAAEGQNRSPPPPREQLAALPVRQLLLAEGGSKKPDFVSSAELDWAGRETSALAADSLLVITSRCEHLAFDLAGARQLWRHWRHLPSAARPWPLQATPPLLVRDHLLIRRAIDGIHELVLLDRTSGNLLWSTTGDDYIASDALWADQAVWVFSVRAVEGQKSILSLLRLDPATGRITRRFALLEFRSQQEPIVWCQTNLQDDRIVGVGAGVVFCCDLAGRIAWARRQTWVPSPGRGMYDARLWLVQRPSPPIIQDRWVYATQPGTWNIECLDLETGRLRWRSTVTELVGLAGLTGGKLVALSSEGFLGLDPQSGRILWRHDTPGRQEGLVCGPPGGLVYAKVKPPADPNREQPKIFLVWLDPDRGAPAGEYPVQLPAESKPLVGPLVSDGQRLWAFYGKADDSASRTVFEILLQPEKGEKETKNP